MIDYQIGQIFENEYPPEVASFCSNNNAEIKVIGTVNKTVQAHTLEGKQDYAIFTDGTKIKMFPYNKSMYAVGKTVSMKQYKIVEIVVPEPTPEEIQEQLTVAVQKYLDTTAQKLNYDSCLSVCSYVDTGVAKFDEEGATFRQWRSAVWEKGYEIVDAVKAGTRDIPTEEELFAELPTIQLDREELKETSTLGLAKVGI